MSKNAGPIGRTALDFIEAIQNLSTAGEIMGGLRVALSRFGFQFYSFNFLPNPGQDFEDVLLANRLPDGWLKLYNEKQYVHADPAIRHCSRVFRPYRWYKEAPYNPKLELRAVEV